MCFDVANYSKILSHKCNHILPLLQLHHPWEKKIYIWTLHLPNVHSFTCTFLTCKGINVIHFTKRKGEAWKWGAAVYPRPAVSNTAALWRCERENGGRGGGGGGGNDLQIVIQGVVPHHPSAPLRKHLARGKNALPHTLSFKRFL